MAVEKSFVQIKLAHAGHVPWLHENFAWSEGGPTHIRFVIPAGRLDSQGTEKDFFGLLVHWLPDDVMEDCSHRGWASAGILKDLTRRKRHLPVQIEFYPIRALRHLRIPDLIIPFNSGAHVEEMMYRYISLPWL
jgi:hypothetical protein